MKLPFKILRTSAILIITITVSMFIASFLMRDRVAGIILKSLNKDISTKFEIGSVKLSFLNRFPKAVLNLKNILVHSSPGFDRTCFSGTDTDTLLSAESVSLEFSIMDIIKGIYYIEKIGIKVGDSSILLFVPFTEQLNFPRKSGHTERIEVKEENFIKEVCNERGKEKEV